jgi:hypothetical protein
MAPPSDLFDDPSYILSIPHMPKVESCILGLALRFILLGRVDTARDFTELLHSRPRLQNLEFAGLRALVPYWHKTYFPAGFPRNMKADGYFSNYIHSEQQKGLEWPFYVPQDQRTEDEAGITAIMEPSLDRYDNPINSIRTVALDLAIKLAEKRGVEPSHDTKVLEIIASIAEHFPKGWAQVHLVDSPSRVSVFMSGALAKAWGLSDKELDSRAAKLFEACRQRYWRDPSTRDPETISELLESCNHDSMIGFASHHDVAEKPTSLYKPPATEQEILDLEERLNINLPDDFKAFLRISNGFEGIWNGYFRGPPLRSTKEIDWLDYTEYELTSNQIGLHWLDDFGICTNNGLPEPPIFTNVICIASEDIDDVWLIPPPMMQEMRDHHKELYNLVNEEEKRSIERAVDVFAGSWHEWENLEWGCVTWTCGGSASLNSYKSFKAWLETAAWDAKDTEKESDES